MPSVSASKTDYLPHAKDETNIKREEKIQMRSHKNRLFKVLALLVSYLADLHVKTKDVNMINVESGYPGDITG